MTDDLRLRELFDRYYKIIYRLAANRLYTYTGSTEDAQDIVQEVFLLAAQKDIHKHPNPGGWLAAATNNLCMNYSKAAQYRKMKLIKIADSAVDGGLYSPFSGDITENIDTILSLKSILPPDDFKIVIEHYVHRRSLADIASEMGFSHVAIRVRIHRIRLKLKNFYSEM